MLQLQSQKNSWNSTFHEHNRLILYTLSGILEHGMRIFFLSSEIERSEDLSQSLIFQAIESLGYTITSQKPSSQEVTFAQLIHKSDTCIFEVNKPNYEVGHWIEYALQVGKPTILLFLDEHAPTIYQEIEDEKLLLQRYSPETCQNAIRTMCEVARDRRDKRFNFFLSPRLLHYVEETSKAQGVTKSKLLRDMISSHMRAHPTD